MPDTLQPLVDDLLEWIATPRPYAEVMDAWRTSCPRLPVWEEANRLGLVQCGRDAQGIEQVALTARGQQRLRALRGLPPSALPPSGFPPSPAGRGPG